MTPIVSYLKDGRLPEEKDEAKKVRVRSARYVLMNEVLYRRGFYQPYLRCLAPDEANYVLREIHEGACGNHSGARSLVHKVVRAGYYWPNMQADAKAYVKVCDQCQRFSNVPRQPSEYLTPMVAPWPFADEVFSGGHRLLYQMGGGRTVGKYHTTECEKLRVEKHYMQVWSAKGIGV